MACGANGPSTVCSRSKHSVGYDLSHLSESLQQSLSCLLEISPLCRTGPGQKIRSHKQHATSVAMGMATSPHVIPTGTLGQSSISASSMLEYFIVVDLVFPTTEVE